MADDTLSPVGFDRPFIKAYLDKERRFALACIAGQWQTSEADTVRGLLLAGLTSLGWDEERCIKEFAAYRVRCLQQGTPNEFEGR